MGTERDDELSRVQDESIRLLRAGRLPVSAARRLEDLRGRERFFTSDLTVSEFALGVEAGVRPVSQVMGSCVYHRARLPQQSGPRLGHVSTHSELAEPWNEARRLALHRLRLEAQAAGADAVIGVHITAGPGVFAKGSVEFRAIGTAVRLDGLRSEDGPILCALSGQDFWKLHATGQRIVGVVGATQVAWAVPSMATQQGQRMSSGSDGAFQNREIREFSRAMTRAVHEAIADCRKQAAALGAAGIVGVTVSHEQEIIDRENPEQMITSKTGQRYFARLPGAPRSREDLIVTAHALGTAIVDGAAPPRTGALEIVPVRRLDPDASR